MNACRVLHAKEADTVNEEAVLSQKTTERRWKMDSCTQVWTFQCQILNLPKTGVWPALELLSLITELSS